ncbi:hypothetical protein [Planomonospora sp. ID82291]|uniref:hypothetical protein n=1 Tax=Planomonospora sp. ID82291 TaxID=2738136 RepID=UPI0018C3F5F6|nr:hypothetical protein [Planomonospora sp. ID82291]MBG0818283.1 hypothetical protein [Planomonospora sp. ID82291]
MVQRDARAEFATRLAELLDAAPELGQDAVARAANDRLRQLARTTPAGASQLPASQVTGKKISAWRNGDHLPASPDSLRAVVHVLAVHLRRRNVTADQVAPALLDPQRWDRWWEAARKQPVRAPQAVPAGEQPQTGSVPPGSAIAGLDPLDLEVHPAIRPDTDADTWEALPAYIPRTHDRLLADLLADVHAQGRSRFRVLVGGSSTGKTRACWEAVRDLPSPWRLWHPRTAEALLADIGNVAPHTVVWLNETQRYLLTPEPETSRRAATQLRALITDPDRGPILVLGTLWPPHWDKLTAAFPDPPDLYDQAGELLKGRTLRLPEAFTGDDLTAAVAHAGHSGDARLAEALRNASDGRLTQYLAGGFALAERYDNAGPGARALLDAAVDARRLGHSLLLPRALLEYAAAGYLTDEQWETTAADDNWLEEAFAYVTNHTACRGARAPLTRHRPRPGDSGRHPSASGDVRYRLADYLEQYGAEQRAHLCPSASLWDAATLHASPVDQVVLGMQAQVRLRYRHAIELHEAAMAAGSAEAMQELAIWRAQTGEVEEGERLAIAAMRRGHTDALFRLSIEADRAGEHERAERLANEAADDGRLSGLCMLILCRELAGKTQTVERLTRVTEAERGPEFGELLRAYREKLLRALILNDGESAARRPSRRSVVEGAFVSRFPSWDRSRPERKLRQDDQAVEQLRRAGLLPAAIRSAHADAGRGWPDRLLWLARTLRRQGEHQPWTNLLRYGLDGDGSISRPWPPSVATSPDAAPVLPFRGKMRTE